MTKNIDSYFENGKGFKANPFKNEYLTDEERKEPFRYYAESFVFFSKTADLSAGLEIYRNEIYGYPGLYYNSWEDAFMHDMIQFSFWWFNNIFKRLNGFNGLDTIKIKIDPTLGLKFNNLTIPMKI